MNISNVESLGLRDGSAFIFDVDPVPDSHEDWSKALGELPLREIIGPSAGRVEIMPNKASHKMERRADGSQKRDWWAGDHIWHGDGLRWHESAILTGIVCKEASAEVPGTEILDTVKLREQVQKDGFWEAFGVDEAAVHGLLSVFKDGTYYREALPYMRDVAKGEEALAIAERIDAGFVDNDGVGGYDNYRFADIVDRDHKTKVLPLISPTLFSGDLALLLDGGVRNAQLVTSEGQDRTDILHALRLNYLSGRRPHELGLVSTVHWRPGRAIIFPSQIGAIHRALPGNDCDRLNFNAFLVEGRGEQ